MTLPLADATTLLSLPPILLIPGFVVRLDPNPMVEITRTATPMIRKRELFRIYYE